MNDQTASGKAKGGFARAAKLTPDARREIAQKAANSRWSHIGKLPKVTHPGDLKLLEHEIPCAVLDTGVRVLSERGVTKALGAKRGGAHWQRIKKDPNGAYLPVFISANNLKPFINTELASALGAPIEYYEKNGLIGRGVPATLLPDICNVWLRARDEEALLPSQIHIAKMADMLMRGLAHVGIIALVDEATGYQKDRARDELSKILEAFVAKELQPWIKTFQSDFYEQMFRLRSLPYPANTVKRPKYFGHLTNDIIYYRLAPGVWKELKDKTEKDKKGRNKHKLFQNLTPDIGHPKLRDLLTSVTTVMKLSDKWADFKEKLDRIHPPYGQTLSLDFGKDDGIGI